MRGTVAALALLVLSVLGVVGRAQATSDPVFACSGYVVIPAGQAVLKVGPNPACTGELNVVATVNLNRYGDRTTWVRSAYLFGNGRLVIHLSTAKHLNDIRVSYLGFQSP